MPVNHFDQASRFAAKFDPRAFLGWLLGLPPDGFMFREWLDTRDLPFPGGTDRASDTVAHVADITRNGVPWAVAIEFQTKPDPEMFGRMLGYLSGLWLNRKPDAGRGSRFHLRAAVVNLTGNGSASREMTWPAAGLHTQLNVVERNLEHESGADLLEGLEAGRWSRALLPWLPLMVGGDKSDMIDRWKALADGEPDTRRKAEFAGIALVFAEKAGRKDIWEQKLEGWNMEESTVVNAWIAKGEARGKEIGTMEAARASILRLGTKKFGPVSQEVREVIEAIQDRARLESLLEHVLDATDWADLIATA